MNIELQLKYTAAPQRPVAAWLIEGATSAQWLAELVAWRTPLAAARLFLVPTSPLDATPCGLLVTGVARSVVAGPAGSFVASPHARAYGVVQRRLYLPVEATWEPMASAADVEAALPDADERDSGALYLWHPRAGLVSFAPAAALGVADLLAAAPAVSERWDAAVPGVAISARLLSLEPVHVPSATEVLDEGRGDIGSQPLNADKMPRAPQEPPPGAASSIRRAVDKKLAQGVMWFTDKLPGNAPEPTWINKLRDWAAGRLSGIKQSLEASRRRELTRLMNLLLNDPDQGLKFALPMGGGEGRGIAPPSNRLGERHVDFSLRGLGGGRPTDTWDVSDQLRRQLTERYRELAAREISLGRHRRAAYIFATLLNDVQTAALTLEDGRHFREAAALFDEKLKRPSEAARCLRQGGLRSEAIALYRRLGEYEIVGDLHAELEQLDEARAAWRTAVAEKLKAGDRFGAARLLELKLNDADEAYETLLAAWPHEKQAVICLTEAFALLGRRERHEAAANLVTTLTELRATAASAAPLAEILGAQAKDYPAAEVRARAADQARVVCASRLTLPEVEQDEARRLTRVVGDLVPTDLLLGRDSLRFLQTRRRPSPVVKAAAAKAPLSLLRELQLPRGIDWKTATATNEMIVVAGIRDGCRVTVARADWSGTEVEEVVGRGWSVEPSSAERPILLSADPFDEGPTIVHLCGAEPLQINLPFHRTDRFQGRIAAGSHRGLSAAALGISHSERGTVRIAVDGGESLLIYVHTEQSKSLAGFVALDLLRLEGNLSECRLPLPMVAANEVTYIGIGSNVCAIAAGSKAATATTSHAVTQLVGSAKGTRARLAVALEQGGFMIWDDDLAGSRTPFATEMIEPRIAMTRDGSLIAAGHDEIEVYSTRERKLKLIGRAAGTGAMPLALLSTRQANRFAMLTAQGSLRYYALPSD